MKPIFYTIFFPLTLISQSHEHYHFTRAHVSVGVYNISCTKTNKHIKRSKYVFEIRTNVTRFSVKDKNGKEASATHIAYYDIIVRASFCYLLSISKLGYFTCLTFKIIQKSVDFYQHSSSSSRRLKLKHHHHLFLLFRFLFILITFPPIVHRNLREKSERRWASYSQSQWSITYLLTSRCIRVKDEPEANLRSYLQYSYAWIHTREKNTVAAEKIKNTSCRFFQDVCWPVCLLFFIPSM